MTTPRRPRIERALVPNTDATSEDGDGGLGIRPARNKRALIEERLHRARGAAVGDISTDEVMRLTRRDE